MRSQSDPSEVFGPTGREASQAGAEGVSRRVPLWWAAVILAAPMLLAGCPSVQSPSASRPQAADKWFRRAQVDFQSADVEEARDSIGKALAIAPADPELKLLAGRIALARLDYDETLRLLKGLRSSDASGLRGRALWYKGDLDTAADELDAMLDDPDVKDEWAKSITKLARRGAGRTPFTLSGAMLAAVDLPHVSQTDPLFVVPLEIDGEAALAMIATGVAEVVLDSATRPEPSWISLRFDKRFEVHDVPATTQDLSAMSKQIGAPIKAVLGINLLRHMNVTIDYAGHQFVVRNFSPPPPPDATRINLYYARGGGMVLKTAFGGTDDTRASLHVDSLSPFPILLDRAGWKKAGFDAGSLKPLPQDDKLREGILPMVRLGQFPVTKVPGSYGPAITHIEKMLSFDIDGVVGVGLLANFRITFGDGGRLMWIEDDTAFLRLLQRSGSPGSLTLPQGPTGLPGTAPEPLVAPPSVPPRPELSPPSNAPPPAKDKKPGDPRPPKAPSGP